MFKKKSQRVQNLNITNRQITVIVRRMEFRHLSKFENNPFFKVLVPLDLQH